MPNFDVIDQWYKTIKQKDCKPRSGREWTKREGISFFRIISVEPFRFKLHMILAPYCWVVMQCVEVDKNYGARVYGDIVYLYWLGVNSGHPWDRGVNPHTFLDTLGKVVQLSQIIPAIWATIVFIVFSLKQYLKFEV